MSSLLLLFILLVIVTEALTELVVKSKIALPFREAAIAKYGPESVIAQIISCGYCFSVWAAIPTSLVGAASGKLDELMPWWVAGFVWLLVIHRSANYLHNFVDKHLDKFYSRSHYSQNENSEL